MISVFHKFKLKFKNSVPVQLRYLIARVKRQRIRHVTFIGITGSAGKTTATNLTATILATFGPCQQTSQNNMLPAIMGRIWHTQKHHRYCVAEFAASGPGTMDQSVRLFKPDIAVITVIGRDHYAAYRNMDAIVAEKEKIISGLSRQGIAVLNIDDPFLRPVGERCNRRVIWFGSGKGADLRLIDAHSRWPEPLKVFFEYQNRIYEVRTQLHGAHLAISVLASLGVALAAGLPLEKAIQAIAQVKPVEGRMQLLTDQAGVVFIRDDCKAPYWSLEKPLTFLKEASADRKIAVIGIISDVSGDNTQRYKKICRQVRQYADLTVFVGPHAHRALRARQNDSDSTIQGFSSIYDAAVYLQSELRKGDLVLLKGSFKADHLLRLIIHRNRPVQCWKDQCNLEIFCDHCSRLHQS